LIQALQLFQFRNFSEAVARFSPKVNIFLGENGQGKTNLLEAISILTTGQSFRYADNENFLKFGAHEAFLKAKVRHGELDYDLQLNILKSRKNHLLNGKKTSALELSKKFPSVVFSPESLAAIKEGADQRRQLVDDLIISFHPRNVDLVGEFRRALKTRNKVLKNYVSGDVPRAETEALLESITPIFLRLAVELTNQRLEALRAIYRDFNHAMQFISKREAVDISVDYVISEQHALNFTSNDIEFLLRKRLNELHDAELASGASLVGPQKHDVVFLYAENDSRFYCSQGQQRALILSFKMAQIVYHKRIHGSYPALMLDDVLSELDAEKRDSLIRFLSEINTQIFITTTDFSLPSSLKSEDCAVLKVREGQIITAEPV
jgi:DNA replication and repair protein RecF